MDDLDLKALAYILAREVKKYHHEKDVYLGALQHLKNSGVLGVDELVEDARQSAFIQGLTDRAFAFLDEWLPPIPEANLESIRRLWLEKLEFEGKKPN